MKKELTIYRCLCATEKFVINGVDADSSDFGEGYDRDSGNAEPYACADMQFTRISPTSKVLDKYSISVDEYEEIAAELEDKLSFGSCGWCV